VGIRGGEAASVVDIVNTMNIEAPAIARRLFVRLCRGDNLLLSRNGSSEDAELFARVEADEEPCRTFFETLGFRLQRSDNCYYFTADDEPQANQETKLDRMIRLVRLLDFLSTHIENFGEGQIFSASALVARCNNDPKAERFLQFAGKGGTTNANRLDNILQSLVRQGYLSEYDASRQEYRVLSAINYLFEFADRIEIHGEASVMEDPNAEA
jgi:hypothetical protein